MTHIAIAPAIFPLPGPRSGEGSPKETATKTAFSADQAHSVLSLSRSFKADSEKSIQSAAGDVLQISGASRLSPRQSPLKVSAEQVVKKLEAQQHIITVEALEKALLENFPDQRDRELAVKILTQMTRFANMKSLNGLQSALVRYCKKNSRALYYQGEATLGSTLDYLSLKHKVSGIMHPFVNPVLVEVDDLNTVKSGAILLDQPTKARLRRDPQLCEHIRQNDIKLLYPPGWDEGVNPFNQQPLEVLMAKLPPLIEAVRQQSGRTNADETETIQLILNQPTQELMTSLNLKNSLEDLKEAGGYLAPHKKNAPPSVEKIVEQLAPKQLGLPQLKQALADFMGEQKPKFLDEAAPEVFQLVLSILNEQAQVYSPLRLTRLLQEQHRDITARAQRLGLQPHNIIYYIDEKKKSYGLVNYHYAQVNGVAPEQLVDGLPALSKHSAQTLLTIVDDLASSGDSLVDVYNKLREALGPEIPLHFAPLVSTSKAVQVFQEIQRNDSRCTYRPAQIVPLFEDQAFYQQASPALQAKFKKAILHLGHGGNGLSLAFPYMAPDNNNGFFARYIAPLFTLNRAGCKNIQPPAPFLKTPMIAHDATHSPEAPASSDRPRLSATV
ncbi:phosphoribosyltransferase-like protein [Vampirovibrio chlorellavorus]|uniref:phosphoribosyltransferase-like protein n=1 Tax=Vampirovibrio chlorellavorus TaxID=758823 RepID=UPI0026F039C1|nr:hypothetical protein [Vampirovibrio chlorellavorus]